MTFKTETVDASQISPPTVLFTERAWSQLQLILDNDPTIDGSVFRIAIAGKECDGFTYEAGFTASRQDDFLASTPNIKRDIKIALDPFSAYYCSEVSVDFIQDFEQDAEGFVIVNPHQDKYFKKFWRQSPGLTPPLKPASSGGKS